MSAWMLSRDCGAPLMMVNSYLHFQPQFTADSRQLTGIEALVRWQHPEKGLLPPAQFIPICEESGLIIPLGRWVLREACRYHARLQQLGRADLSIAVNVSAGQFLRGDLLTDLRALRTEFALPSGAIELELTESVVMESPEVVIAVMQELRDLGVSMSLDDFGTGYSSLAYLKRLPLDRLKIDRAFVHDLPQDEDDAAICTSVIALASALGCVWWPKVWKPMTSLNGLQTTAAMRCKATSWRDRCLSTPG
jgi:EAL domain-containing protein (putative c-di-GMP-specific phosphodiesterase class I)